MTHAELRQRLRAYADGTLGEAEAEIVRTHLASGCPECLREVFTRPVGLPRPSVVVASRARGRIPAAVGTAAVVAIGSLLALREWPRASVDPRLDALEAEVAQLREEHARAEAAWQRRLDDVEARAAERRTAPTAATEPTAPPAREGSIAPPAREASAESPSRAAGSVASTAPSPSERSTEPRAAPPEPARFADASGRAAVAADDDSAEAGVPGWVAAVLASEGARVVPLGPGDTAGGGTGFAVWSRERRMVVVSASNLPVGETSVSYRVRVTMVDGSTAWVGDVVASPQRDLVISVALPDTRVRVERVDLYRDPPGTPVLTARLMP